MQAASACDSGLHLNEVRLPAGDLNSVTPDTGPEVLIAPLTPPKK